MISQFFQSFQQILENFGEKAALSVVGEAIT